MKSDDIIYLIKRLGDIGMKKVFTLLLVSLLILSFSVFSFTASAEQNVPTEMLNVKNQIKSGTTAQSATTSARFIASVDKLSGYQKVGWAFSLTDSTPTKEEGCVYRESTSVYSSIIADGIVYYPRDIYGSSSSSRYVFVFEITDIPQNKFSSNIYVCAYVILEDGTVVYGTPSYINISEKLVGDTTSSEPTSSTTPPTSSDDIKFESTDSGWDNKWH